MVPGPVRVVVASLADLLVDDASCLESCVQVPRPKVVNTW